MFKTIFKNCYHKYIKLNYTIKRKIKFGKCVSVDRRSWFEGNNVIGDYVCVEGSNIGEGSYIRKNTILNQTNIGRFSCIAPNVSIIKGRHPVEKFVSIHPAFYSTKCQAGFSFTKKDLFDEHKWILKDEKKWVVCIGNDVWIGESAKIMEGVTIGDGAVVAAGALVTTDVAPYSIVGGIPAKKIRYRFTNEEIVRLLEVQWWNWEWEDIKNRAKLYEDINNFIKNIEYN